MVKSPKNAKSSKKVKVAQKTVSQVFLTRAVMMVLTEAKTQVTFNGIKE